MKAITIHELGGLVDSGRLRLIISAVLSLEETITAEKMAEDGHTVGKVVMQIC